MARHKQGYSGELRSVKVTVQLTPSERAVLEEAARAAGITLSQLSRELCLRRAPQTVAGMRRDPDRKAILGELHAIGVNLNQMVKLSNTHRSLPHYAELKKTTDQLKATFVQVMSSYDPAH